MNASELRARLDANHAQRLRLIERAGASGTGALRCAQLNDGIAALLEQEASLLRELAEGRVTVNGALQSDVAMLLVRTARAASAQAAHIAAQRRDSASKLRAQAGQVRDQGEAAFADDGLVHVPGVGVMRQAYKTDADRARGVERFDCAADDATDDPEGHRW